MFVEVYKIVKHDDGWAYQVGDVFSETFETEELATRAAEAAAQRQRIPDASQDIEYQTKEGEWKTEHAEGDDRPATDVQVEDGTETLRSR